MTIQRICSIYLTGALGLLLARPGHPERVDVSLVLLDAVVTDRNGESVRGLRAEDFELLVDNARVPIESVEENCVPPPGESAGESASGSLAETPRHLVVLFDISHMMLASRNDAIRATLRFVETVMTPRDRVMILAYMRGLRVISGFTGDRAALLVKLDELLRDTRLVDSAPLEEANTIERLGSDRARPMFNGPGERRRTPPGANPKHLECLPDARQAEIQTGQALRAIANTMPALAGIRGRKALVFYTETLRANPGIPFYTACGVPFLEQLTYGLFVLPELEELTVKANAAGVSFYPVHAAGMSPLGMSTGQQSSRDFQTDVALTTGGKNFVLMKNPLEPFQQALQDLSCHYVLSYKPPDRFAAGRHSVKLLSSNRRLRIRSREYFTVQEPEEVSESQLAAALSSPGLYRDLPLNAHVYSLGDAEGRKRQVLLHVSVPAASLTVVRSSGAASNGSVRFRGGVVARGSLRCEFTQTVPFQAGAGLDDPSRVVGLESLCALEDGEHEVVVVARDEMGGGLGTFWGKIEVKPAERHTGAAALLWGPSVSDVWVRPEGVSWLPSGTRPYYVQDSFKTASSAPSSLTVLICNDAKGNAGGSGPASVRLVPLVSLGESTPIEVPAAELPGSGQGPCRLLKADIPPGSLSAGSYLVQPRLAPPWRSIGAPSKITVQ